MTDHRDGFSARAFVLSLWSRGRPYLVASLLIAIVTVAILPLREAFDKALWGTIYLFILVAVAIRDGLYPAVFCAIVSFFAWNYFFLAPYETFDVASGSDWLVLFTFLIVGISIGVQTSRLRRRERLSARVAALEESDRLKSTLVSMISHELKTPLASLTATVTNLLENDTEWNEAWVHGELSGMERSLVRLDENISALIDLSRLESDSWKPYFEIYDLGDVVGTTLARLPASYRDKISYSIPPNLSVRVDFNQISRAIQTVVENAVHYGEDGLVILLGEDLGEVVRLRIEDRGPGVSDDEKERVFEKFYRGRNAAISTQGTGVGLAIARELVCAHGGRVWIEDAVPHGARVIIELARAEE